jgi:hypothetical protein
MGPYYNLIIQHSIGYSINIGQDRIKQLLGKTSSLLGNSEYPWCLNFVLVPGSFMVMDIVMVQIIIMVLFNGEVGVRDKLNLHCNSERGCYVSFQKSTGYSDNNGYSDLAPFIQT